MLDRLTPNNAEINRHAARVAQIAPPRIDAQEPVSADNSARLHPEAPAPAAQITDQTGGTARPRTDTTGILGNHVSNLFFVQHLAQEQFPDHRPAVAHDVAVAAYPSIGFDNDILLPGQAVPLDWYGNPRLDIRL